MEWFAIQDEDEGNNDSNEEVPDRLFANTDIYNPGEQIGIYL